MKIKTTILQAAKATFIPESSRGLWHIKKISLNRDITAPKDGRMVKVPAGEYTQLWRWTNSTIQIRLETCAGEPGELVMTDSPDELNTHLSFMLRAHGRVLITGLGLGCVIRGCLANPAVEHVVCIERDPDVIRMVGPHMPDRCTILQAEAVSWVRNNLPRQRFDCAWHDCWSDPDKDEPHLQVTHSSLFVACHRGVKFQGAWAFPKYQKRIWRQTVGGIIA